MPLDTILRETKQRMDKSVEYFDQELRGIRTGRATTALIEFVRVDYYGTATELRELANISVPEPTQLLVKPFDPGAKNNIIKALEVADLGLNPQADGDVIRINVPPPSGERRKQLITQARRLAEEAKVAIRNERRDANKHIDQLVKDKDNSVSEDQGKDAKTDIDEQTKRHVTSIDAHVEKKVKEIEDV
jgi:ribosome recycling factor